ncbi:ATPase family AAA domain-containing protein 5b isoform 2-T2 [Spinachia spinachia]
MQNKLKRNKKSEHVPWPAEVRTSVLSESSCLDDGTSPGKGSASPPAADFAAAGAPCRKAPPKGLTTAPMFCLEEIQPSNRASAVGTVFSTLQENAGGKLQSLGTPEKKRCPENRLQEKRKRGNGGPEREPKCLRPSPAAEEPFGAVNKLSRAHRLRRSGDPAGRKPHSGLMNHLESHGLSLKTSGLHQRDSSLEDVLWTDKYSPRHSSEVLGNSASVDKLRSWLKKWKLRADCDERRKMAEKKREENRNHSWDRGDFQGEGGPEEDDGAAAPCSTALISGPAGVGKTASVYACAQELGFKVFEVNCSSQRCGRHVLAQLKEATQSHLVEISGRDPLAPAYFNNYAINGCTQKSETLPGKMVPSKIATPRNRAAKTSVRSRGRGKTSAAAATLADYFKKAKADHAYFGDPSASEKADGEKSNELRQGCGQTVPKDRKTATSLILFEEVDVIFEDDVGFLAAIKTFMTTTKRPVVLTTSGKCTQRPLLKKRYRSMKLSCKILPSSSDPLFRERFNCSVEEMVFKRPSAVNVCSYLRLVALAEGVRLESEDAGGLAGLFGGDVRRCLLQLQLWASPEQQPCVRHPSATAGGDDKGDQGCTASSLGLYRVTQRQLLNLLMRQFWADTDMEELLGLLAESWRGGVPLLYSNLELLLPLEAGRQNAPRRGKKKRVPATSDAASKPRAPPLPKKAAGSGGETEANAATGRLEAMADFFDLMSYLDSTTALPATGLRRPEAFVWTGSEMKDGSLDEMSEDDEVGGTCRRERLLEIRAAVEGLGCRRCCWRMLEASNQAPKYRQEAGAAGRGSSTDALSSPVSLKRPSLTFGASPPCAASVSRRRYGLSRKILGSASFGLLGSRRAVAVDYMPILRHICRLQRAKEQKDPSRCLRYLGSTQLGLSRSTIQLLAKDFSSRT